MAGQRNWHGRLVSGAAAVSLASALVLLPSAGAATRPARHDAPATTPPASTGGLTATARIDLGTYSQAVLDGMAFSEAPNDSVYFSTGSVVSVVEGSAKPVVMLHTSGPVLALAATNADLYVQVGPRITEYSLPGVMPHRTWTLPDAVKKPTMAGLFPSSGVLWSWSDWATDESGFEYATVVALSTSSSVERIVDEDAYPADMAADATGLYYETVVGTKDYLAHAQANGTRALSSPTTDFDAPLALGPGHLAVFAMKGSGVPYVDEFSSSTLTELHSSRLGVATSAVVGTAQGVLAVESPCSGFVCPTAKVVQVDAANGAETGGVTVPDAQRLLAGTYPSAIAEVNGSTYLVRLS